MANRNRFLLPLFQKSNKSKDEGGFLTLARSLIHDITLGIGIILLSKIQKSCQIVAPRYYVAGRAEFLIMMDWKLAWFVLTGVREYSRIIRTTF
jgi:hypothetical protein